MSLTKEEILEAVSHMTLLEVADLIKIFEEKFMEAKKEADKE